MGPRGRPKKYGATEGWTLLRSLLAVRAFDEARDSGEKYSEAVKMAVAWVREKFPDMHISETEVKRALADFRSKGRAESVFAVDAGFGENIALNGSHWNKAFTLRLGPCPKYRRHNASADPTRRERA